MKEKDYVSQNLEFELKRSKSKVRCNMNAIVISLVHNPCSAFEIALSLLSKRLTRTRGKSNHSVRCLLVPTWGIMFWSSWAASALPL